VPPDSDVPGQGLQVQLQLRVFKIITVDMTSGTLRLQAWRRLRWKDPRLAWNVSEWNGVTEIRAVPGIHTGGAADAPDNNIWVPRLHHYNSASHPEETLEEGAAWIYPDGSVFQSKPGATALPHPHHPSNTDRTPRSPRSPSPWSLGRCHLVSLSARATQASSRYFAASRG